jgi:hypothetical protein
MHFQVFCFRNLPANALDAFVSPKWSAVGSTLNMLYSRCRSPCLSCCLPMP